MKLTTTYYETNRLIEIFHLILFYENLYYE